MSSRSQYDQSANVALRPHDSTSTTSARGAWHITRYMLLEVLNFDIRYSGNEYTILREGSSHTNCLNVHLGINLGSLHLQLHLHMQTAEIV